MIYRVKTIYLFFLLLLCLGCTNESQKKAVYLEKELETVSIISLTFDSLLQEVYMLPSHLQVPILLNISYRDEILLDAIKKQESILVSALSGASKKQKKKILLQLIIIYTKMSQLGITDGHLDGVKWCNELIANYSLSQKEAWDVNKMKVVFLNKQESYRESLAILYELLKEHRNAGNMSCIIEDLCTIANYFARLNDYEKALSIYKEAQQLSISNNMLKLSNSCLASIIDLSYNLQLYNEVIDIYHLIDTDFLNENRPSIYSTLAACYLELHEPDSARICLSKMNKKSLRRTGIVFNCRMAETYISENQEDSVTYYLNKAMKQFEAESELKSQDDKMLPMYFMYVYPSYASLLQKMVKPSKQVRRFA